MGTIAPTESQSIRDRVVAAGGEYLEAPVLGSIPQVKTGELLVMVGSTEAQFDRYGELLKCYSPEPMYVGRGRYGICNETGSQSVNCWLD